MKASKFADAQKAFVVKQGRKDACGGYLPQGRDQSGDHFELEEEMRWAEAIRDAPSCQTRGYEWAAEEDRGGSDAGS